MTSILLFLAAHATPAAAPEWHALRSSEATASSYLQSNWNRFTENYHPTYVLDDDPKTAWVEGVDGNGEGQTLTLPISTLRQARQLRLRIRNGYQKSAGLLTANAAPADVRIHLLDPSGRRISSTDAHLEREMGFQEVLVPVTGVVSAVELEIVSVHEGSRYRDTCISDILVDVDGSDPYDAAAEERRLGQAKGWIRERVDAARFFASQPVDYPFVTADFVLDANEEVDGRQVEQALAPARAAFERVKASTVRYDVAHQRRLEHRPEGLWELQDVIDYLAPDNLAFFETERDQLSHSSVDYDEEAGIYWQGETWTYAHHIEWADEARTRPSAVQFRHRKVVHERGTWETDTQWLFEYDGDGRVTSALAISTGTEEFDLPWQSESLFRFVRDPAGKISGFTQFDKRTHVDWDQVWDEDGNPRPNPPRLVDYHLYRMKAGA